MSDIDDAGQLLLTSEDVGEKAPIGKGSTGMPPGNPNHISPTEGATRKAEIAELGMEEAARRAWARANAHRAAKGAPRNPKPGAGGGSKARPDNATDFGPMGAAPRSTAKGRTKAELEKWSSKIQFAHALIAMRINDPRWVLSEDEAMLLTEAAVDLLDFYDVKIKKVGPWGLAAYALLMVYGPRIASMIIERNAANKPQQGVA